MLNAVRIVSRVLPIVHEAIEEGRRRAADAATGSGGGDGSDASAVAASAAPPPTFDYYRWLWTRGVYSQALVNMLGISGAVYTYELSVTAAAHVPPSPAALAGASAVEHDSIVGLSLAEQIVLSLTRLAFVQGDTVWSLDGVGAGDVHGAAPKIG